MNMCSVSWHLTAAWPRGASAYLGGPLLPVDMDCLHSYFMQNFVELPHQRCLQPFNASQHVWWPAMLPLAHARYFTGWPQCYCQGGLGTAVLVSCPWNSTLEHGMQFGAYASYQVTQGAHGLLLLYTSFGTVGCMASAYCGSRPCRHCPSPCNAWWLL
jgi:hypothetical protein